MNITGIIAEYNPFHSGHFYQIAEARKRGADYVIAAISGDFVQRGEPAVFDKHTRAHMALAVGADLVLEFPVCFSVASAEDFAACGVALFSHLGAVDTLCFGSECGDLKLLRELAEILEKEPEPFSEILREKLKTGAAFPQARAAALAGCLEDIKTAGSPVLDENGRKALSGVSADALQEILAEPNNILALEYLKAIRRQNSRLVPLAIPRMGAAYHDQELPVAQIPASASALRLKIRKLHENGQLYPYNGSAARENMALKTLAHYIPAPAFDALMNEGALAAPVFADDLSSLLSFRLLRADRDGEDLTEFLDVPAELANRLKRNVLSPVSFTAMVQALKTRQYTGTRISRALLHILLDIRTDDVARQRENGYVSCARILGFRKSAEPLLHRIKKVSELPLVTKVPDALSTLPAPACAALRQDLYAAHLYRLVLAGKGRSIRDEYTRPLVILP